MTAALPDFGPDALTRAQHRQARAYLAARWPAPSHVEADAKAMSEKKLQADIRGLCRHLGLMTYHTTYSVGSDAGFPDLTIVNPRTHKVLFAELKTEKGSLTKAQVEWVEALDAIVMRPSHLFAGVVHRVLAELALGDV